MKYIIALIAGILILGSFLAWTNKRDAKVIESSQRYEECIKAQYDTTPMEYYYNNGEYPVCAGE